MIGNKINSNGGAVEKPPTRIPATEQPANTGTTPPPARSSAIEFTVDSRGIGSLTLNCPGEKVNKLSQGLLAEFEELVRDISVRSEIRAVIIVSGKANSFIAGADIEDFLKFQTTQQAQMMSRKAQDLLDRIEDLRFPVIAAINGACLGGGMELALACHYRIATHHEKTVFGQPEVQLGLIPGAGGTQRLPKLIGVAPALKMILTGKRVFPKKALRLGLIDELVAPELLLEVAHRAAYGLVAGRIPRAGRKKTSRRHNRWLEGNPVGRRLIFIKAKKDILTKGQDHYPAPLRALEAVRLGVTRGPDRGYEAESRAFGELAMTDVCRQLIQLFFASTDARNRTLMDLPQDDASSVRQIGVVGGGFMGAGIAAVSAAAGIQVRVQERGVEPAGRLLRSVDDYFQGRVSGRSMSSLRAGQNLDRVSVCLDYSGFKTADLVIEAVFEDLELKRHIWSEIEAVVNSECVLASNTSSLPIGKITEGANRPESAVGMHFFSPVHKMPLLEVIVTPKTEARVAATVVAFGRNIGKTSIVVRDGVGFYTTRTLAPYLNEAARLLEEGAGIDTVDAAMRRWGFPVGPLALIDEVGLDVAAKVAKVIHEGFGSRLEVPSSIHWVGADGRLGRKNGRGFYLYDDGPRRIDPGVYSLLPYGEKRRSFPEEVIQKRLSLAMINEAALCLQEGILLGPRDGDVGAVLGLGFPPLRGGPFRYIDFVGADEVVRNLEELREQHGDRFQPAPLLVDTAGNKRLFYPN